MTLKDKLDLSGLADDHPTATRWVKRLTILLVVIGSIIGGLYGLVLWVGIVDAFVYSLVFIVGAGILPFFIAIAGHDLPLNGRIGRLHVLLGAIAYNHHYLVDFGDTWDWCPGDENHVYIDGRWYEIDGGFENRSVLGWRPFGIVRFKDASTMEEIRADTAAETSRGRAVGAVSDGGVSDVVRGGYDQKSVPAVSGREGSWLVDLKRLFSRGVRGIGDTELVETAEEVIERGEVTESAFEGWQPVIGAVMGLLFGVIVGYLTFFG